MCDRPKSLRQHLETLCNTVEGASPQDRDEAFQRLRPHLVRAVRSHLHRRMRPYVDSTDIEQSCWAAFMQIPNSRLQFENEGHLLAYIARMARNKIIDRARKLDVELKHRAELQQRTLAAQQAVDESEQGATSQQIRNLVSGADSRMREVVELRLKNLKPEEIADELGISRATVYRILTRLARRHALSDPQ
jgi:RNA polymerase sigma-70 factor (ECF subfamily)